MDGLIGTRLYQITPITHITHITPSPWPESKDKIIQNNTYHMYQIYIKPNPKKFQIDDITHITHDFF